MAKLAIPRCSECDRRLHNGDVKRGLCPRCRQATVMVVRPLLADDDELMAFHSAILRLGLATPDPMIS